MRKTSVSLGLGALALSAFVGFGQPAMAAESSTSANIVSGTVTAMSGTTVPAILTVTSGATVYTVNISADTKIVRKYNGATDLGEFLVGDSVEVRGALSNDVANTLTATRIKNTAIQRVGGTFKGKIIARNCDDGYFTFKPDERVQQTVYFTTGTKFTRGGEKIGCASLQANERAKVIGVWRKATKRIDADRVIVDLRTISGTISSITLTNGGLPATVTIDRKVKVKAAGFRMSTSESETLTTTETWTLNITSATKLYRHYLKSATIEEFLVGDKLEARGTLAGEKTLNTRWVRNSSLTIKYGDIQGTVLSVDADAKTFVLRTKEKKYGDLTVAVATTTKYVDENGLRAWADVSVGDKLKVLGTYTSNTKKLAATRVFFKEAQDESESESD